MVGDNGVLACVDAKTGKEVWSERLGGGEYAASPVYANGRMLICSIDGQATIFETGKAYKLVAEGKFDAGFMASPAFAGKSLILRSKSALYRIEP
jgi:outer membrane protein assembly factor BamB